MITIINNYLKTIEFGDEQAAYCQWLFFINYN